MKKYGVILSLTLEMARAYPSITVEGWAELYLGEPINNEENDFELIDFWDERTDIWKIKIRSFSYHSRLYLLGEGSEYPSASPFVFIQKYDG